MTPRTIKAVIRRYNSLPRVPQYDPKRAEEFVRADGWVKGNDAFGICWKRGKTQADSTNEAAMQTITNRAFLLLAEAGFKPSFSTGTEEWWTYIGEMRDPVGRCYVSFSVALKRYLDRRNFDR